MGTVVTATENNINIVNGTASIDVAAGAAVDVNASLTVSNETTLTGSPYTPGGTDVAVTDGGTGRSTGTTAYALIATGTTATGAQQTLASGATTEILVGGGSSALPVWTTATGSGAPVRAISPTLVTPVLGTPTSGTLSNCTAATDSAKGVVELATSTESVAGTSTTLVNTPSGAAAQIAVNANPKAMSQGVNMTYSASFAAMTLADNSNLHFGTGDFTLAFYGSLADWNTAALQYFYYWYEDTNNYINMRVGADNTLQLRVVVDTGVNWTISSSVNTLTDNTNHLIAVTVDRTGNATWYVDGYQYGTATSVSADAGKSLDITATLYLLGTNAGRTAGRGNAFYSFNRALTAAEVLDLYRNGIAYADKWGSQTAIYTSDFSAGVDSWAAGVAGTTLTGNTDSINGSDDWLKIERTDVSSGSMGISRATGAVANKRHYLKATVYNPAGSTITHFKFGQTASSNYLNVVAVAAGSEVTAYYYSATGTDTVIVFAPCDSNGTSVNLAQGQIYYFKTALLYPAGATLALEPEGIQPAPGQWLDSSTNKLHAMQPATGSSLVRPKKDFEYRWTNTWTASSAAQYVGGLNQAVLSADHHITTISTQATVTTDVENLELGDGSDADRFVAAFTPSATRTNQTIANQNDGTNLKLVYTPAAEATMTVETIIRGFIWEP